MKQISLKILVDGDQLRALYEERDALEAQKENAYAERNQVVACLARMAMILDCKVGLKKTAIDGWETEWHNCVYIDLPTGQVSWHYHDSHAWMFEGLPAYEGEWDGHTTEEKYERTRL